MRNSFKYLRPAGLGRDRTGIEACLPGRHRQRGRGTLAGVAEAWGEKYWAEFVPFLGFDREIRRIVCTTNAIESVNARIRKVVRAHGHFSTEQAALKCVHLAVTTLDPTRQGRARWTQRWTGALNAFDIRFDGRLSAPRA